MSTEFNSEETAGDCDTHTLLRVGCNVQEKVTTWGTQSIQPLGEPAG